ncbi:hypothetical protein D3C77_474690 [compost metagenome]
MGHFADIIAEMAVRREAHPLPGSARKNNLIAKLLMLFQHAFVFLRLHRVIIPIHERDIVGNHVDHVLPDRAVHIVIFPRTGQAEEHIAPHHWLVAIFPGDLHHFMKMLQHQHRSFLVAMLVKIFAESHHMGFIHSDIDSAAR